MPIYSLGGLTPKIHPDAYVAPSADIIGDVTIEANASIWFGAVLRGDAGAIVIGENSNIQDLCILHEAVTIGKNCVLGHGVLAHGITMDEGAALGNGALVHEGSTIGAGAIVAAGSVINANTEIPKNTIWMGIPAKMRGEVPERISNRFQNTLSDYLELKVRYANSLIQENRD